MFGVFGSKKRINRLEDNFKVSFNAVKKDFEGVGEWIKHLNSRHDDVSDSISSLKRQLSTLQSDFDLIKEHLEFIKFREESKQLSKKQTAVYKQTADYAVGVAVQTPVQTANFYGFLKGLTSNERLVVLTLLNSDMKLSYEDIARLLGKERSTIRGQINAIKRKSEHLIAEIREPNGKKRVFIEKEIKEKLAKYAKVRSISRKGKKRTKSS